MQDAYLYDGIRTPFGRHGGALAGVRPDDLLGLTLKHLVERSSFARDRYEEVLAGCTNQAGEDSRNIARHAALLDSASPVGLTLQQAETLIEAALDECERFYPVFQFVLWGDKTPQEAIAAALVDTAGEA